MARDRRRSGCVSASPLRMLSALRDLSRAVSGQVSLEVAKLHPDSVRSSSSLVLARLFRRPALADSARDLADARHDPPVLVRLLVGDRQPESFAHRHTIICVRVARRPDRPEPRALPCALPARRARPLERPEGSDRAHRLAGDLGDQVEVPVVVADRNAPASAAAATSRSGSFTWR
jgi:hypothetical protein